MSTDRPTKPRVSAEAKTVDVGPPQLTASCFDCGTRTTLKDYGLLGHSAPDGRACPSRRHRPGSIRVVAP